MNKIKVGRTETIFIPRTKPHCVSVVNESDTPVYLENKFNGQTIVLEGKGSRVNFESSFQIDIGAWTAKTVEQGEEAKISVFESKGNSLTAGS